MHGSNDVGTDTKQKMKIIVIIIKRMNEFIHGATYITCKKIYEKQHN